MKGQLSFEFMVYLAISVVSLIFIISMFVKSDQKISLLGGASDIEQFVALVNTNMAYSASNFRVYVPVQLCEVRITNNSVQYNNETYLFASNVSIDTASICAARGNLTDLYMTRMPGGTFVVR